MELTIKQTEAYDILEDSVTNELHFGGGAGGGKSLLGCVWLAKNCFIYPKSRWLLGRAVLKTLKETTLETLFEAFDKLQIPADKYNYNSQKGTVTTSTGSVVLLKDLAFQPRDPNFDSLGSLEVCGAFIDEIPEVTEKAVEVVKTRCRYKLDEFDIIPKVLGTGNPSKGFTYKRYYYPWKTNSLPENIKFIQSLVTDNPHISKHYIENLKKLSDIGLKERLLFGNWDYDDDPSILIPFEIVQDIFRDIFDTKEEREKKFKYITCDVARHGNDKTIIFLWEDWDISDIIFYTKNDTKECVNSIQKWMHEYNIPPSRVTIDEDGVGGGVKDYVTGSVGFVNNSKAREVKGVQENFRNLRSQCYWKLCEKVNAGELRVYPNVQKTNIGSETVREMMSSELSIIKRKNMDRDDEKISIIPKETMKTLLGRSPDVSDSMMMRCIFDLKKYTGTYMIG